MVWVGSGLIWGDMNGSVERTAEGRGKIEMNQLIRVGRGLSHP